MGYERILALIRGTTTEKGLVVYASLNEHQYAIGIKITDEQMQEVHLCQHRVFPEWNYTIKPTIE